MNKKNYKLVVVLSICMVLTIILLSSYAFWKIKDGQSGSNTILGSCLKIDFEEELDDRDEPIIGITMEKAWPMSDVEGSQSPGYTFTVKNTCDDAVNYEIVLETIKIASPDNKMPDQYVKVRLDDTGIKRVSELDLEDNDTQATYANDIDKTYKVFTGTVTKDSPKTHTIRQWYSSDAPSETIGYNYESKVKIYAGQGIVNNQPVLIDSGSLADYSCPENASSPDDCTPTSNVTYKWYDNGDFIISGTGKASPKGFAFNILDYADYLGDDLLERPSIRELANYYRLTHMEIDEDQLLALLPATGATEESVAECRASIDACVESVKREYLPILIEAYNDISTTTISEISDYMGTNISSYADRALWDYYLPILLGDDADPELVDFNMLLITSFANSPTIKNITIEDGITGLDGDLFRDVLVDSITLPNSVSTIGVDTFNAFRAINGIHLGNNISEILHQSNNFSNYEIDKLIINTQQLGDSYNSNFFMNQFRGNVLKIHHVVGSLNGYSLDNPSAYNSGFVLNLSLDEYLETGNRVDVYIPEEVGILVLHNIADPRDGGLDIHIHFYGDQRPVYDGCSSFSGELNVATCTSLGNLITDSYAGTFDVTWNAENE